MDVSGYRRSIHVASIPCSCGFEAWCFLCSAQEFVPASFAFVSPRHTVNWQSAFPDLLWRLVRDFHLVTNTTELPPCAVPLKSLLCAPNPEALGWRGGVRDMAPPRFKLTASILMVHCGGSTAAATASSFCMPICRTWWRGSPFAYVDGRGSSPVATCSGLPVDTCCCCCCC